MTIHILSLFPNMFTAILEESIIKRARKKNLITINVHNLRDWATDKHGTVDDTAYGGGAGMILKVDVLDNALNDLKQKTKNGKHKTILLTPKGEKFNQTIAKKLASDDDLILICGHYGGFDERIRKLVDMELSLGDFVLTGGEIPAMAIVDAVTRLIPGVINPGSLEQETHSQPGRQQYPQYTKPAEFTPKSTQIPTLKVPEVLLSGHHENISTWRKTH